MSVETVLAQQVSLYGEPLSARFGRLLSAYRIPQSRLAATIGLSAPMLSQLATGQRVKISNPSVYARLLRLEQLASSDAVQSGDPAQLQAALEDVSASHPQLTTQHSIAGRPADGSEPPPAERADQVIVELARTSSPPELRAAAGAVPHTALGELLLAASRIGPE